jgi:Yip1 domain
MMRSSMNTNSSYDGEDDFAPNPFRTNTSSDLLDNTPRQQQQFHDPFQPHVLYAQQPQQQQHPMMTHQPMPPNPNMGIPPAVLNYQQQPPTQHLHPGQYLTGQMDMGGLPEPGRMAPPPPQGMLGWLLSCFRLDQATKLFDVDADDVALRLRYSLTQFFQPDYFRTTVLGTNGAATSDTTTTAAVAKGPDLYGPFWVSMTLIFVLGVASNLSDYLHYQRKSGNDPDMQFEYDITHVLHAMYIVFGFSFGVPTGLWLASTFCMGLSGSVQWDMWVCCYGYSMAPIMAGALVAWWLPFWIWHFLAMTAGVGASCLLVLRNLSTPLLTHEDNHAKAAPLLLAMLVIHVAYLLVLMLNFFPAK